MVPAPMGVTQDRAWTADIFLADMPSLTWYYKTSINYSMRLNLRRNKLIDSFRDVPLREEQLGKMGLDAVRRAVVIEECSSAPGR